jgi:hypothetical protein
VFGVGNMTEIVCAPREEPYMQWFSAEYVKFRTVFQSMCSLARTSRRKRACDRSEGPCTMCSDATAKYPPLRCH